MTNDYSNYDENTRYLVRQAMKQQRKYYRDQDTRAILTYVTAFLCVVGAILFGLYTHYYL